MGVECGTEGVYHCTVHDLWAQEWVRQLTRCKQLVLLALGTAQDGPE